MNENLVSIIIPCYNDAQYIEQSVQSAINQTYQNIEIIVVDDGSNAETKSVLRKLEPKITKLISQENRGQSAARNRGIEFAKGEFILVLDSDDYIENILCENAVLLFNNNFSVKLVTYGAFLVFSENKKEIYFPKGGDIKNFIFYNEALGTSIFKRKDWQECGGYDESMRNGLEDWEFFINLLKKGGSCEVVPKVMYNYRKRDDSTTNRAMPVKYEILNYIYLKHKELYSNNIEDFIEFFSTSLRSLENEKLKVILSNEYKIGTIILKPFRFVKRFYRYLKIYNN